MHRITRRFPLLAATAGSGKVNVILTADGQTANPVQAAIQ